MRPHAFVAMPFGVKAAPDGVRVDFDRVYRELIAPALEAAGMEPLRADQELRAGEIRSDMFQELLLADLVVADLTTDNPNVWYELGVRHGMRARGVVLISGGRNPAAFDVYTDRKLRYGLRDGAPDPATLAADIERLCDMVRATMSSWHGRKSSPVYQLLPYLQEPDWRSQRVGGALEFWEKHEAWAQRVALARAEDRIGDLLVLADEAPVAAFRAQAWLEAGEALRDAGRYDFALEQLERVLDVEPANLAALRAKGVCLQRLAALGAPGYSRERAHAHYAAVLARYPRDAESWALRGRVDKDAWIAAWRRGGSEVERARSDAAAECALLRAAIESYLQGFRCDPAHYYSGINALTLMHLDRDLTGDTRHARFMASMSGAVRFAAENDPAEEGRFWAKATVADVELLEGTPVSVAASFGEAAAQRQRDWFSLNACLGQLHLLAALGFRPQHVGAGVEALERALARLPGPRPAWQPRQVVLFSGHRVDAPGRHPARFPPGKVEAAAAAIEAQLAALDAGPDDLALAQAAAGGDILFLEACLRRGLRCEILLPFAEPEFVERSILPSAGGDDWRARYYALKQRLPAHSIRVAAEALGPAPRGVDAYERCNLWLMCTALAWGVDKLRLLCLWDGGAGDGAGGTAHLVELASRRTGRIVRIDPGALSL